MSFGFCNISLWYTHWCNFRASIFWIWTNDFYTRDFVCLKYFVVLIFVQYCCITWRQMVKFNYLFSDGRALVKYAWVKDQNNKQRRLYWLGNAWQKWELLGRSTINATHTRWTSSTVETAAACSSEVFRKWLAWREKTGERKIPKTIGRTHKMWCSTCGECGPESRSSEVEDRTKQATIGPHWIQTEYVLQILNFHPKVSFQIFGNCIMSEYVYVAYENVSHILKLKLNEESNLVQDLKMSLSFGFKQLDIHLVYTLLIFFVFCTLFMLILHACQYILVSSGGLQNIVSDETKQQDLSIVNQTYLICTLSRYKI